MEIEKNVLAGRRLASGPPAEAGPACLRARRPLTRLALGPATASPAQAHAALSRPPRRTRLHRLPGRHAAPVHRRRGAVPAPTGRAPPSRLSERALLSPHSSLLPPCLPASCSAAAAAHALATVAAPPTTCSTASASFFDSSRPELRLA